MPSRRAFLTAFKKPSDKENSPLVVRPPYGLDTSVFHRECVTCLNKSCVASCDEQIIFIQDDGTPALHFVQSGCTFCEACAEVCEAGVLSLEHTHNAETLNATFRISTETCVAHHGVICFSCKEPCIDDAILFNGMFNPVIDMEKCTACGFCLSKCPTQAIDFSPNALKEYAS